METLIEMRLQLSKFNFDDLKELFEKDFDAGIIERNRIIEDFINELPDEKIKRKFRAYQFSIDMQLRKFVHPIAKMEKIKGMLYEQTAKFVERISKPNEARKHKATVTNITKK